MCFNGNYKSYAIDPEDWDKYITFKSQVKRNDRGRQAKQIDATNAVLSLAKDNETTTTDNRLSVGVK